MHIVQRGNNKQPCFFDDRDRTLYLGLVQELAPRFGCAIHAYVLMTNHVHLLVTPECRTSASSFMKHLSQRYVQWVNRHHGRSGSLWEGRFRSSIVDTDLYLLRCYRYIEMNPVRAAMVADAMLYPWSSHRCNALGESSPFLSAHDQYLALGTSLQARADAYSALFAEPISQEQLCEIRDALNGGFALGSPEFLAKLRAITRRRVRPGNPGRPAPERPLERAEVSSLLRSEPAAARSKTWSVPGFGAK